MNLKGIVFDLGGTLIEYTGKYSSWPDLETPGFLAAYSVFKEDGALLPGFDLFQMAGFDLLPQRWRLATSGRQNLTVPSLLEELLSNFGIERPTDEILVKASTMYEHAVCVDARPIQGSRFIVSHINTLGLKLGLVSNTMFSGTVHMRDLARFGMLDFFDATIFSADAGLWKPNPAIFLTLLNSLGLEPSEAIFIGDDPGADVIGGKRAGMYTIHFLSNNRFPSPDGATPDLSINKLSELKDTIAQLSDK